MTTRQKLLFLILILASAKAQALIDVGVVGGLSMASQTSSVSGVSLSSKSYLSYGILGNVSFPISSLGLTAGILYTEMGAHAELGASKVDEKVPYYQIPVILDFWFINTVAVGAGFYYSTPGGNVVDSNANGVYANSSLSFSQANYANSDYGLALHGEFKIAVGKLFYASANAIYELGIPNVSTVSNTTVRNSSVLLLAGFGVGI